MFGVQMRRTIVAESDHFAALVVLSPLAAPVRLFFLFSVFLYLLVLSAAQDHTVRSDCPMPVRYAKFQARAWGTL